MQNEITFHKGGVGISVSVYLFRDGGAFVAYCPSLDLTGYDLTEDAARRDFEFVLNDWLREQTANGTLRRDLEAHGWKTAYMQGLLSRTTITQNNSRL